MNKSLEELLKECTVKLILPSTSNWGTGFFVSPGQIVTCGHVVKEFKTQIKVQWQGRLIGEAFVEKSLSTALDLVDLALLKCEFTQNIFPPCVWLDRTIARKDDLYIYGYSDNLPEGDPVTAETEYTTTEKGVEIIKFKGGQIRPGLSGSPVLNTQTGKVCGIVSDTRQRATDLGGLAISVTEMLKHWRWLEADNQKFHKQDNRWSKESKRGTSKPKFADNLAINDRHELDQLKDFIKKTTLDHNDKSIDITDFIANLPARNANSDIPFDSIILKGNQGAGKTTFLSSLYSFLESNFSPRYRQLIPIYINLTDYIGIEDNEKKSIKKSVNNLEDIISQKNDCHFFLMVDGLTARANYLSTYLSSEILEIDFDNIDAVIWSVSDEFDKKIQEIIKNKKNPYFPECCQKNIQINSVETDDPKIDDYLKLFIILHNRIHQKQISEDLIPEKIKSLKDKIKELKIKEVDQYILSIIYQKLDDNYYLAIKAIGRYLEKYCQDKFGFQKPELLEKMAFLSYKLVVASFYLNPENLPPQGLQITDSDRRNESSWRFLIENKVIRDFLAIWYVIRLIYKSGLGKNLDNKILEIIDDDFLGYDFPESMNKYSRDLIKNLPDDGRTFINGIQKILHYLSNKENMDQTINILCYFLGRCPSEFRSRNIQILKELRIKKDWNDLLNNAGNKKIKDENRIRLKTQYRTISVSCIRAIGTPEIPEEFLLRLLRDKEMASIDRGYHRIYYGDDQPYKDRVPYCYQDFPDLNWFNSFLALKKRITEELGRLSVEPQEFLTDNVDDISKSSSDKEADNKLDIPHKLQHLIFTLVSFVQSRRDAQSNRYLTDEQIEFTSNVVNFVLKKGETLIDLKQYLETFKVDLERKHTSWNFIIDLYRLKWTPRRGWLKRNLDKFYLGRIESVADHTLFTVYLAHFLLPDCIENSSEYDKRKVKDILTFHDVLEAYTGDFIPYYMDDETQKSKAIELSSNALAYIRYKETYARLNETKQIFDNCEDFSNTFFQGDNITSKKPSINAKIARDIDKLENFIQLYIYRDLYGDAITQDVFNEFKINLKESIKTPVVNELLNDFIAWIENSSNCDNLFDFSSIPFREDNLLESNENILYTDNSDRTQNLPNRLRQKQITIDGDCDEANL